MVDYLFPYDLSIGRRSFHRPILWLAASLVLAGCDGSPSTPVPVATVQVTAPANTLVAGETLSVSATPRDASGNPLPDRPVEWSSSNNAIATVSRTGLVAGVNAGSVTITAESEGQRGQVGLTVVPVPVASVSKPEEGEGPP
jgi:uncharacterized protein YjdB